MIIGDLQSKIIFETQKFEKYKQENERRKHNYIPLAMEILKIMAEKNTLLSAYSTAENKRKEYIENKTKAKK